MAWGGGVLPDKGLRGSSRYFILEQDGNSKSEGLGSRLAPLLGI